MTHASFLSGPVILEARLPARCPRRRALYKERACAYAMPGMAARCVTAPPGSAMSISLDMNVSLMQHFSYQMVAGSSVGGANI
jgi:hypothetical protein